MVNAYDRMKSVHVIESAALQFGPAINWLGAFEQVRPESGGQDRCFLGERCHWGECRLI